MNRPVSFPDWKDVLARSALTPQLKSAYTREILSFLKHCKAVHAPATDELARQYLGWREKQSQGPSREALRWFYRTARQGGGQSGAARPPSSGPATVSSRLSHAQPPPPAATDLGDTDWEQALVRELRRRGMLWRTEQAYREWAVRFARYLAPRSPYAAAGGDVEAFLGDLAVKARAGVSTQKQALNALVFLMQEAAYRLRHAAVAT